MEPTDKELMLAVRDGKVERFRVHFPLIGIHPKAMRAAMVAEAAARQGRFWEIHNVLLSTQGKWIHDPDAESKFFDELGKLIAFNADSTHEIEEKISKQVAQAKSEGIAAVPTFLINGRKIEKAPDSFQGFDDLIVDELKQLNLLRGRRN